MLRGAAAAAGGFAPSAYSTSFPPRCVAAADTHHLCSQVSFLRSCPSPRQGEQDPAGMPPKGKHVNPLSCWKPRNRAGRKALQVRQRAAPQSEGQRLHAPLIGWGPRHPEPPFMPGVCREPALTENPPSQQLLGMGFVSENAGSWQQARY